MTINKADLPYLYQSRGTLIKLPNGIQQEIEWVYSVYSANHYTALDEPQDPLIVEQVNRSQIYLFDDYSLRVSTINAWHYNDKIGATYTESSQGYRNYWEGEICQDGKIILQPEVAILLGLSNDLTQTPAYIETISLDELRELLAECHKLFSDDDAIAFITPLPIETPSDAPPSITDAMRRMRASAKLQPTRGRAAMLKFLLEKTGIAAENGGWRIRPEEIERRQGLGLRS